MYTKSHCWDSPPFYLAQTAERRSVLTRCCDTSGRKLFIQKDSTKVKDIHDYACERCGRLWLSGSSISVKAKAV